MPAAGEWNVGWWSRGKRKECGDTSPDSENLPQNKEEGFKVFVKVIEGGRLAIYKSYIRTVHLPFKLACLLFLASSSCCLQL